MTLNLYISMRSEQVQQHYNLNNERDNMIERTLRALLSVTGCVGLVRALLHFRKKKPLFITQREDSLEALHQPSPLFVISSPLSFVDIGVVRKQCGSKGIHGREER